MHNNEGGLHLIVNFEQNLSQVNILSHQLKQDKSNFLENLGA